MTIKDLFNRSRRWRWRIVVLAVMFGLIFFFVFPSLRRGMFVIFTALLLLGVAMAIVLPPFVKAWRRRNSAAFRIWDVKRDAGEDWARLTGSDVRTLVALILLELFVTVVLGFSISF